MEALSRLLLALHEVSLRAHSEAAVVSRLSEVLGAHLPLRSFEVLNAPSTLRCERLPAAVHLTLPVSAERHVRVALEASARMFDDPEALDALARVVAVTMHHAEVLTRVADLSRRAHQHTRELREERHATLGESEVVAVSAAMRAILEDTVPRVARYAVSVLLRGESGVGKDVVARRIHARSSRAPRPFIEVNCAAMPEALVESQLFGHERGAFTGATARHRGCFERAEGGTLLLNEIGELTAPTQAKLLRVLQTGEFERVGSETTLRADVRVIAATLRDLDDMVSRGAFRLDLYYRLRVVEITVPPLRERPEDLTPLALSIARRAAAKLGLPTPTLSAETLREIASRPWPGNVRQLEHELMAALILSRDGALTLTPTLTALAAPTRDEPVRTMDDAMRRHIERALAATDGKLYGPDGAAAMLKMKPTTLQSRMKRLRVRR